MKRLKDESRFFYNCTFREHKDIKDANKKFWMEVFKALYIPQLTKWLDKYLKKLLKRKRCETCRHWRILQNNSGAGEKFNICESKKAVSIFGREKTGLLYRLLKTNRPMFKLDPEGTWFFTHKDHGCRCWKKSP